MTTLSDGELNAIRAELGNNILTIGAEPYIWHARIFDVIQQYCVASSTTPTTSSTSVTAVGPAVLTLGSVTGISQYTRLVLDTDDQQETATVRTVSGSTVSVVCRKLHSGTYNVEIESSVTMVRAKLAQLAGLQAQIDTMRSSAGLKRVDEVEFQGDGRFAQSPTGLLMRQRVEHRRELASLVGLGNYIREGLAGGGGFEVY